MFIYEIGMNGSGQDFIVLIGALKLQIVVRRFQRVFKFTRQQVLVVAVGCRFAKPPDLGAAVGQHFDGERVAVAAVVRQEVVHLPFGVLIGGFHQL